jgi:hypothetical protein
MSKPAVVAVAYVRYTDAASVVISIIARLHIISTILLEGLAL